MSVARRANLVFGVVFVLALSVAGTVFVLARQGLDDLHTFNASTHPLEVTVAALQSDFYNYDDQMNMYVAVLLGKIGQRDLAETTYQQATSARDSMGRGLDRADGLAADPRLRELLQRARQDYVAYNGFADQTRKAATSGDLQQAVYITAVGNLEPSNDMMPTLDAASSQLTSMVAAELDQLHSRQSLTQAFSVGFGLLVMLILAGLRLGLHGFVLRPVAALRDSMTGIATGRLARTERVKAARHDEFGEVATAFNTMLDALAAQDAELARDAADREADIQAGAERTQAAERSVRSRAQAAVEESTAAVLAELTKIVVDVDAVRDSASIIDDRVRDATARTHEVVQQAGRADSVAGALGESLRRVGGMAVLIAGVADQTKLLALNATIEAARAGEAGKGFAVVASEVKELAQATSESTSEISSTVGSLEQNASAMTTAISAVADGITGVDRATAVLTDVAANQREVVQRLNQSIGGMMTRIQSMSDINQRLERRQHPRAAVSAELVLDFDGGSHPAQIIDLSEGGLRCKTDASVGAGRSVTAKLRLSDQPFTLRGTVLGGSAHGEIRLEFTALTASDIDGLRAHLPFH